MPDGSRSVVAEIEGGPNGAAVGPDGAIYLCNNGGSFTPVHFGDLTLPGGFDPGQYIGGRIQRVDPVNGQRSPTSTPSVTVGRSAGRTTS